VKPIKTLLTWWGKFRFMFQFLGFYLSVISLIMTGVTAYNTTLRDWAMVYFGVDLSLYAFGLAVVVLMLLGMVVEKVVTVPYLLSRGNAEAYKHGNPMRTDLEEIKRGQVEMLNRQSEQNERIEALCALLKYEKIPEPSKQQEHTQTQKNKKTTQD
jgi:hypothetical protein